MYFLAIQHLQFIKVKKPVESTIVLDCLVEIVGAIEEIQLGNTVTIMLIHCTISMGKTLVSSWSTNKFTMIQQYFLFVDVVVSPLKIV